jgi:DNA primase
MKKRYMDKDELNEIRANSDWRRLFQELELERDEKKSRVDDWWARSPLTMEDTASFHINDKGWFCFSSHEGGGVIDLVQKVVQFRTGQAINCYEAGRWLLDHGVSSPPSSAIATQSTQKPSGEKEKKFNHPIRQNLLPALTQQETHPEFVRREISTPTCDYLGCGYLEKSNSSLQGRIVFQVRGVRSDDHGDLSPVVLTHIGRATTEAQKESGGKWTHYAGFHKSLELYNIDKVLLDDRAKSQADSCGYILITEGCFDVLKLAEAEIFNVVATFGAQLSEDQIPRIREISEVLGIKHFRFVYDRDKAGVQGAEEGVRLLQKSGFQTSVFDWEQSFSAKKRISEEITDICDCSPKQLQWLRKFGLI